MEAPQEHDAAPATGAPQHEGGNADAPAAPDQPEIVNPQPSAAVAMDLEPADVSNQQEAPAVGENTVAGEDRTTPPVASEVVPPVVSDGTSSLVMEVDGAGGDDVDDGGVDDNEVDDEIAERIRKAMQACLGPLSLTVHSQYIGQGPTTPPRRLSRADCLAISCWLPHFRSH